jgi:hypothetical protein
MFTLVCFIDILLWRHTNVWYCKEPLDLDEKVAASQIGYTGYSTFVNPSLSSLASLAPTYHTEKRKTKIRKERNQ